MRLCSQKFARPVAVRWGKRLIDLAVKGKASRSTRAPLTETGGDAEVEDEETELARKKRKDVNDVSGDDVVESPMLKKKAMFMNKGKRRRGCQPPRSPNDLRSFRVNDRLSLVVVADLDLHRPRISWPLKLPRHVLLSVLPQM